MIRKNNRSHILILTLFATFAFVSISSNVYADEGSDVSETAEEKSEATKEMDPKIKAMIDAFGGGGMFGEDWKTPKMTREELDKEVKRVSKNVDEFKKKSEETKKKLERARGGSIEDDADAAMDAAADAMDAATDAAEDTSASTARENTRRARRAVTPPVNNTTGRASSVYEPKTRSRVRPQVSNAPSEAAPQYTQDMEKALQMNQEIQALVMQYQQEQAVERDNFSKEIMQARTKEERERLKQEFVSRMTEKNQALMQEVQAIKAAAQ